MKELTRQQVVTLLTVFIVGVWTVTLVARIWLKMPNAIVLDSCMPLVVAYWFATSANDKRNGNGNGGSA